MERNSLGASFTPVLGWACIIRGFTNRETSEWLTIFQGHTPSTADLQTDDHQLQTVHQVNPGDASEPSSLLRPKSAAAPTRTRSLGRSSSCIACHTANHSHTAHTYEGDCVFQPGRTIYGNSGTRRNPDQGSGGQHGTVETDIVALPGSNRT